MQSDIEAKLSSIERSIDEMWGMLDQICKKLGVIQIEVKTPENKQAK